MEDKKIRKHKQIAAIIGIVLLVAMYLAALIFALCDFKGAKQLFGVSLACTIFVPAMIWFYIWLYGYITHKKTIATVFKDAPSDEEVLEAMINMPSEEDCKEASEEESKPVSEDSDK